jgi:hypothetical protein
MVPYLIEWVVFDHSIICSSMPIGSSKMSPNNTFFDEDLQKNTLKVLGNCKRAHVIACPTAAAKFTLDVLDTDKGLHLGICALMHPPSQYPCVHLPQIVTTLGKSEPRFPAADMSSLFATGKSLE